MKKLTSTPEFLKNIDWTELRNQKTSLLNVIARHSQVADNLTGILHLIDAIQDYAVDEMEIPEMYVFDFEKEEDREKETPEEKFARENAETIYDMCTEGDSLYIDNEYDEMNEEFIDSIINDKYHADIMKADIRQAILKGVTEHPEDFEKDENGNFTYDYRMCENFGGIIDNYLKEVYESTHTCPIYLCSNCASDNVRRKAWKNPNTNELTNNCEDSECWCNDCENHVDLLIHDLPLNKKVIGFQAVDPIINEIGSAIFSLSQARKMIKEYPDENLKLLTIWSGDIEEHQLMFEGDPRQ